jgi:hypothetical protein
VIKPSTEPVNGMGGTLRSLKSIADASVQSYMAMVNCNLGNDCLTLSLPLHRFFEMSEVANERNLQERGADGASELVAQRKLDPKHAQGLATYLLRGLLAAVTQDFRERGEPEPASAQALSKNLGPQPYFAMQPIVTNIRTCERGGGGLRFEAAQPGTVRVFLSDRDVLWVIDGQHRRFGMDLLFTFLKQVLNNYTYPKRPALYPSEGPVPTEELAIWSKVFELARSKCTVLADVHLGLSPLDERQLFHDLNNLSKKVESSLAFQFDSSNPVNLFIKEALIDTNILRVSEKDVVDWQDDEGAIARKDIIAINARLLLNKTSVAGAKPTDIGDKFEVAKAFWEAVVAIDGFGERGAKQKTVAAQPIVLKAIAKLVYDFAFGRDSNEDLKRRLLDGVGEIDFSHANPMWRYYELSAEEREASGLCGLAAYLPSETEGFNRDIGAFDSSKGVMRFGAKHNDIFPILADMIRWRLKLPNRHNRGSEIREPDSGTA